MHEKDFKRQQERYEQAKYNRRKYTELKKFLTHYFHHGIGVWEDKLYDALEHGYPIDFRLYSNAAWPIVYIALTNEVAVKDKLYKPILKAGADINTPLQARQNLLIYATDRCSPIDISILSDILDYTTNINAIDICDKTALGYLCNKYVKHVWEQDADEKYLPCIKYMLNRGADPDLVDLMVLEEEANRIPTHFNMPSNILKNEEIQRNIRQERMRQLKFIIAMHNQQHIEMADRTLNLFEYEL